MASQAGFIGKWNGIKGRLIEIFAVLTGGDLSLQGGINGVLAGRLEAPLGNASEHVQKIFLGS